MISFNRNESNDEMYAKTLWFNPDIEFCFNKTIVEYDMQQASLSVSRRFHLLDDTLLDELERMPKDQRTKKVGLIQRDDKQFSDNMINGLLQTRKEFIEMNHLSKDNIITLHSDALMFIQNEPIKYEKIHSVPFIHKHTWTSYIRYRKIELFYVDGSIDYKGIPKQMLQQHTLGMNLHFLKIFKMIEDGDMLVIDYIRKFQKRYLTDQLSDYYYIPFGVVGKFKSENFQLLSFLAKIVVEEMVK